jgi:hypothetical protein
VKSKNGSNGSKGSKEEEVKIINSSSQKEQN